MPQYYFDLRDGDIFVPDEDGVELLDISLCQEQAALFLSDMATDLSMRPLNPAGYRMSVEVRSSEGPLFELSFRFLDGGEK